MPVFTVPLHEYNDCHNPAGSPTGGQFCSDSVTVGITSARYHDDPGYKPNKAVFEDMRAFEAQLTALPGVRAVSVKPGLGVWEGGNEATWAVSYRGNGEALRLLAKTGKQYNQEAVLMLKGCRGANCDQAVELTFDRGIPANVRDAIHDVISDYRTPDGGLIVGGWTWHKRGGKMVLRMVNIPEFGQDAARHLETTAKISRDLQAAGLVHRRAAHPVQVTLMTRKEGPHGYDTYLSRRPGGPLAPRAQRRARRRIMGGRAA